MLQQRVSEVRTQVYLPQQWHQQLCAYAKRRGVSLAQVFRDQVSDLVKKDTDVSKEKAWKEFMKHAGFAVDKDGASDVSSRSGEYWAQAIEEKLKRRKT